MPKATWDAEECFRGTADPPAEAGELCRPAETLALLLDVFHANRQAVHLGTHQDSAIWRKYVEEKVAGPKL